MPFKGRIFKWCFLWRLIGDTTFLCGEWRFSSAAFSCQFVCVSREATHHSAWLTKSRIVVKCTCAVQKECTYGEHKLSVSCAIWRSKLHVIHFISITTLKSLYLYNSFRPIMDILKGKYSVLLCVRAILFKYRKWSFSTSCQTKATELIKAKVDTSVQVNKH